MEKDENMLIALWGFISHVPVWIITLPPKIWTQIKKRLSNNSSRIPKETLRFVLQPPFPGAGWNYGTKKDGKRTRKIIFAACKFYVTNITRGNILITATYMKKPLSESTTPMVQEPPPQSHYWGMYPILPGHTTEMQANYILDHTVCKKGQVLQADIVVLDQFGNEHVIKGIKFKPFP